ncbi:MAG: SET domain-containing protein-lysine N-methyltransferase [Chlamydiales bacterium]|nr:SET domain-containing protein-lysine N-methyltransferase [Chlamydiales bacterium]
MIELLNILLFSDHALKEAIQDYSKQLLKDPHQNWENKWYLAQYSQAFKENKMPDLAICRIDDFFGCGVFAKEPIAAHTYICPYLGIVRKRELPRDLKNDYIFDYPLNCVIDAEEKGGISRYFNHSDRPNLTTHWMVIDGIYHVFFYASQAILPGEQLTFNYGPKFWKS